MILFCKGVMELVWIFLDVVENVCFILGCNYICIVVGLIIFIFKLVDGKFFEYECVIFKDGSWVVMVDWEMLC